jgi:hypothetical protein
MTPGSTQRFLSASSSPEHPRNQIAKNHITQALKSKKTTKAINNSNFSALLASFNPGH